MVLRIYVVTQSFMFTNASGTAVTTMRIRSYVQVIGDIIDDSIK